MVTEKKPLYRRALIALGWLVHHISRVVMWFWPPISRVLFWHPLGMMVPPGRKTRFRWVKRLAGALIYRLALVPVIAAVAWAATIYCLTHPPRQAVATTPDQYSLLCHDVQFVTDDGVTLKGWYVNALGSGTMLTDENWKELRPGVVLCHGYRGARDQLLHPLGAELARAGYDLLLIDFRGHGLSGDAPVSFGTTEAADVTAAVRFLQDQPGIDNNRIGIVGVGMGGYAGILSGPRCKGVRSVVAIDTYPSVPTIFEKAAERLRAPGELGTAFSWGMSAYFGHRLVDDNAIDAATEFGPRGLLLITGAANTRAPAADLEPVITAASANAARLIVPRARDGQAARNAGVARMVVWYLDGMLVKKESHSKVVAKLPPHL